MSQIHKIRSCFSPRIFFGRLEMSELPALKWLIFGCGGVGGYFGARIAQVKGQRVSYIATWLAASDSVTQTFFLDVGWLFEMFEVEECCHEMEDSIVFQIAGKVRNKALTSLKEHGVRITSICGDVQVAWTTDHDTNHIFRCWTDGILIFWMLFDGDSYTMIW